MMRRGDGRGGLRGTVAGCAVLLLLSGCTGGEVDVDQPVAAGSEAVGERASALADDLEAAGLGTLASAVRQVDFDDVVGEGSFTLFAPSDEAFQSMTADELADLTSDPELLASTLRDHVVDDELSADELADMSEVTSVGGTTLEVASEDGTVTVDGVQVVESDLDAGEATVHVTDGLLGRE